MKCRILFSGKNKENIINLSSTEVAQIVIKVNPLYLLGKKKKKNLPAIFRFFSLIFPGNRVWFDISYKMFSSVA